MVPVEDRGEGDEYILPALGCGRMVRGRGGEKKGEGGRDLFRGPLLHGRVWERNS